MHGNLKLAIPHIKCIHQPMGRVVTATLGEGEGGRREEGAIDIGFKASDQKK